MEVYAYYLPQYHEIPENNRWWGEGFTEWTNVKKAQPLFRGHDQPRRPKDGNYYSLDDIETMRWQACLAEENGVDGFIFYHYYFEGKMLLEKPAEMLLSSDVPMPFFFCWANHTWNRAWKNSREVLMEQTYGGEASWEAHFRYLLPFFRDNRYKKIDGKPVFMIFQPNFAEKADITAYFDRRAKESGFPGIYVIESYNGLAEKQSFLENATKETRAVVRREPDYSLQQLKESRSRVSLLWDKCKRLLVEMGGKGCVRRFDGNAVYRNMIRNIDLTVGDLSVVDGAFFAWDNTPRHSSRGYIIEPVNKETFFRYMDALYEKGKTMLCVNAWNEWAEGMYLEPDESVGDRYLSWIREWKESHS